LTLGIIVHFVIGAIAGSIFTVRALAALVGIVCLECVWATVALGFAAGLWSVGCLVAVQVGYLAGIYLRSLLERMGIAQPYIRSPHSR
jgi:hypothetical protein